MSTNNEMRKILRDSASVRALAEAFGVTTRMVNKALNGETRSDPDKADPETGAGYGSERERKGTSDCIKLRK